MRVVWLHDALHLARMQFAGVASIVGGLLYFLYLYGPSVLDPTNVQWVMTGDRVWQQATWQAFRTEAWVFPVGSVNSLLTPLGTSIASGDAIPLVAIPLKLVGSSLPDPFQYWGVWYLASFLLFAFFFERVLAELGCSPVVRLLGVCLGIASPAFVARSGHAALCGQWLIVAGLWLYCRQIRGRLTGARWLLWGGLLALAAAIHPYLTAMVLALAAAALAERFFRERPLVVVMYGFAVFAAPMAVFLALGYFDGQSLSASGFGGYSADLLTLFNPQRFPGFLPRIPESPGEYEGMAYLGAGVLGLALVGAVVSIRRGSRRPNGRNTLRWLPLIIALAVCTLFALSWTVRVAGRPVLDLDILWKLPLPVGMFRSSGRFIWPLALSIPVFAVTAVSRLSSPWAISLLAVAAFVQHTELSPAFREDVRRGYNQSPWYVIHRLEWPNVSQDYDRLVVLPPDIGQTPCTNLPRSVDRIARLMFLSSSVNLPINSGMAARSPERAILAECRRLLEEVDRGVLDDRAIYLPQPGFDELLWDGQPEEVVCDEIDSFAVCVTMRNASPLRNKLLAAFERRHSQRLPDLPYRLYAILPRLVPPY